MSALTIPFSCGIIALGTCGHIYFWSFWGVMFGFGLVFRGGKIKGVT